MSGPGATGSAADRRRLLLLSSSRDADSRYLHHAGDAIASVLGAGVRSVTFVPYAVVGNTHEEYADVVRAALSELGYGLEAVPAGPGAVDAVRGAEALVVGGGNTFHLLDRLYAYALVDALRERALDGVPYIGWSAGSVVACPTIGTTNDMPIVAPPRLEALGLVPFQINAHYTDHHPPGHRGETRAQRIAEYLVMHPDARVIGLREGSHVLVENGRTTLGGAAGAGARLFARDREPVDLETGAVLDGLVGA